jgi:radical S-adenosyl methionine domain-containing protein 2
MLVTNASKLSADYLSQLEGILDWVTISVDSANSQTMTAIGRSLRRNVISEEGYIEIAQNVKAAGMRLKINSVVTTLNWNEDLVGFIRALGPERWKIFQALPVQGQNDGAVDSLLVTREQFDTFVSRHLPLQREGIEVVPEDNHAMSGSYAMIDPAGRFYDNVDGKHHYSRAIREVGVEQAWQDVRFEAEKFVERGGIYKWK